MKAAKKGKITSLDGKRKVSVEEFERIFEDGGDELDQFVDWQNAKVVAPVMTKATKVNVDFPAWVVNALDREAGRVGVARQALIKMWIVERLESPRQATAEG